LCYVWPLTCADVCKWWRIEGPPAPGSWRCAVSGGQVCRRCGASAPRFLPQHEVDDLAAGILECATPTEAQDRLAALDRPTLARVALVLARLVRMADRPRLPSWVSALRAHAEIDRLDELWRLPDADTSGAGR